MHEVVQTPQTSVGVKSGQMLFVLSLVLLGSSSWCRLFECFREEGDFVGGNLPASTLVSRARAAHTWAL